MRRRMENMFLHQTLELLGTVLLMSLGGRLAGSGGDASLCEGWTFCAPATLAAWFKSGSHTWQTILSARTTGTPAQDVLLLQLTNAGKVRFTYTPPGEMTATILNSPKVMSPNLAL